MSQPVFLKLGLNYPHQRQRRDPRGLLLWILTMILVGQTITIGALYVALQKAQAAQEEKR